MNAQRKHTATYSPLPGTSTQSRCCDRNEEYDEKSPCSWLKSGGETELKTLTKLLKCMPIGRSCGMKKGTQKWSVLTPFARHDQWHPHATITMNLLRWNWLRRAKDIRADPFTLLFHSARAPLWAYTRISFSMFLAQFHLHFDRP